jgi:hypothetical protein
MHLIQIHKPSLLIQRMSDAQIKVHKEKAEIYSSNLNQLLLNTFLTSFICLLSASLFLISYWPNRYCKLLAVESLYKIRIVKYRELYCTLQLWTVEIPLLKSKKSSGFWIYSSEIRTESKDFWKKDLACAFTDRICVIAQVQSCWIMLLISAQSNIFLRCTCTCRQTMKMLSAFTRNLDLKSQIPSRTITRTLPRLTAIFLQNSSLRQRIKRASS